MSAPAVETTRNTRVRASRKALETVLDVIAAKGLSVEKLCVIGAQVDISVGGVEQDQKPENDEGLEPW